MTGIEMIAQERDEQINKHGFTHESDSELNGNGQLSEAAIYAINGDYETYPKDWDTTLKDKIGGLGKTYAQRLAVAGALIAAEIDRIQYLETPRKRRVAVCRHTQEEVVQEYAPESSNPGDDGWLCLHGDSLAEDAEEVEKFKNKK